MENIAPWVFKGVACLPSSYKAPDNVMRVLVFSILYFDTILKWLDYHQKITKRKHELILFIVMT